MRMIQSILRHTIKADLDNVYRDSALTHRTLARWMSLFMTGRENSQDKSRSWRSSTSVSEMDVTAVKILAEDDAQYTVRVRLISCLDLSDFLMLMNLFMLRFYGPVNPMGSCRARSVYLTTRLLGRISPLSG